VDLDYPLEDAAFLLGETDAAFRRLRREDPVHWHQAGGFWAITRHADVQQVSRSPALFQSGRGILISQVRMRRNFSQFAGVPPSIIMMDPPAHSRYRKLVTASFTARRIRRLEPRVRAIARESLAAVPRGEVVDFVASVSVPTPLLVIAELLGVPGEDRADFRRWSDAMIEASDTGTTPETLARQTELFNYFQKKLGERRQQPRDDLISILLEAEVEGERLSESEILMFCLTLLVAGNETTRNLVSGGARLLMQHPEQRLRLASDPARIPNAVEEMLRWVSPVRTFARAAARDTELRGRAIAAGDHVVMYYAAANRDEEVFGPDADAFRIDRAEARLHLAFGFGEHYCIGAGLARLEARVLFEELLARRPDFEPAGEPELLRSTLMNSVSRLPVVFAS
jgi:cytochrome P450